MQQAIDELNKALAYLVKAKANMEKRDESGANQCAHANLEQAIYSTKATLKNIRQEQEET